MPYRLKEGRARLTIDIDEKDLETIKKLAKKDERSVGFLTRKIIRSYIVEQGVEDAVVA